MLRWFACLFLFIAAPLHAQLEKVVAAAESEKPAAPSEAAQPIADTQDEGSDIRIARRVRGIFAELPAFEAVRVSVRQGVVLLEGTVPETPDIERAEAIVSRVSGVVTVDNKLERDVTLDGESTLEQLRDQVDRIKRALPLIGAAITVAVAITLLGYALARLVGYWRRFAPNSFLAELIASAIRFAFLIGGVVVALNMLGAGTLLGAVLGGAGVIGLALGFALRETIENYVASLMLSLRQPFRPNDHVVIDDLEGRVIRLTSRATILMTLDGNHLRIPNSQVFKAVILNYTRNPQRRFQFDLGIDSDDDALAARHLGRETLAGLPFVLDDPKPEVRVVEVGDSNVLLRFFGWIDQGKSDFHKTHSLAIMAVKDALEAAGFGLPEPIYRLRFDPRTKPLQFENVADEHEPRPTSRSKASAATEEEDVRPTDEIKEMVDAERANAPEGERDLLDHKRPVE